MRLAFCILAGCLAASAQVKMPEFDRQVLPNGVVLKLLPKRDVPMVTLHAVVRGGSESDPADKAGLASITAKLLRRGTQQRSAEEFSEELDFIGATLDVRSDEQSLSMTSEFLKKDLDTAVELLADALLRPTFPEAEVKKVMAQSIDAAKGIKDNPYGALGPYYRAFYYPKGHPYSRQITGDELSLARIGRDDIVVYHANRFTGKNMVIIAVGDFDSASLSAKLKKAFGSVKSGETYKWLASAPKLERKAARLRLIDKPGATQTFFYIGQPGIHRTHGDRVVMDLVNTLFGGRFTSMLNDELRVNAGLTYGAFCSVTMARLPGAVTITTYTATETTQQAMDLALDVLERFHEKGITQKQLDSAKAYVKGRYPTRNLETAGQLAGILEEFEIFGLGVDEIDGYFAKIDAVTIEQANAAIRKHYNLDNLQFAVMGDASKIKETVGRYAPEVEVISVSEPGYGSPE